MFSSSMFLGLIVISGKSAAMLTNLYVDCKNPIKIQENVFYFWDNVVWTSCGDFSEIKTRIHVIGSQRFT